MRAPPALVALVTIALTFGALPAEACPGNVTPVKPPCTGSACPTFYLVASHLAPGMILALYQESNGLDGLQRGARPALQGGHDACWQGPVLDARVF